MEEVPRVSAVEDAARLEEIIKNHEVSGIPLIIEDWEKTLCWPGDDLFGVDWLLKNGDESESMESSMLFCVCLNNVTAFIPVIAVRDCVTRRDKELPFKEFVEKSRTISEYAEEGGAAIYNFVLRFTFNFSSENERLYGKDAVCPQKWHEWLMDSAIPDILKPGGPEDILGLLPEPVSVQQVPGSSVF